MATRSTPSPSTKSTRRRHCGRSWKRFSGTRRRVKTRRRRRLRRQTSDVRCSTFDVRRSLAGPAGGHVEAPEGVPAALDVDDFHSLRLEKRDERLPRRDPLVARTGPGPSGVPELHVLVREVEKQNAALFQLGDPDLESVSPGNDVLEAMGAEHEIERRLRDVLQSERVAFALLLNRL